MTEQKSLWFPFTHNGGMSPTRFISGSGNYVKDDKGKEYLDATAGGVSCVILGHGREEIAQEVKEQLMKLEYYCLFGYTHPLAEAFANKVAERTPGNLNHVFFSNSGSEAVETALKIARSYWYRNGKVEKTKFISMINGYHGMNFGGISIGGLDENKAAFGPLLSGCSQFPQHDVEALAKEIELQGPHTVAAIILEPVQAAGGVYPPPENFLSDVRNLCDQKEILLILDEVVCGWGRLGYWFGGHRYNVEADIMTSAKGLTSAYVPMGATVVSSSLFGSFLDQDGIEFMHGYTYSGHPAACAAGLKVIEILENEKLIANALQVGQYLKERIQEFVVYEKVKETRGEGMLAAIEFNEDGASEYVKEVVTRMENAGVLVRAQDNHIGIYPPLTFSLSDMEEVLQTLHIQMKEGI